MIYILNGLPEVYLSVAETWPGYPAKH